MSRLIRRKKEIGAALAVALQLTTLGLIGLMLPVAGGPQQPAKAPADSQMSAAPQAAPVQARPVSDLSARRASAVRATKLYEPRASQIFTLATSRAEAAESGRQGAQHSMQEGETPTEATLTTDREDYAPYSYVYISGTGFEPGETVNMIVVQLDPNPTSYEPWDVVADENGNIDTTWYVFTEELIGATMQVTATGQTSGLTASATFTDNAAPVLYENLARTIRRDAFAWGDTVYLKGNLNGQSPNRCYKVDWVNPSGTPVQSSDFEPGTMETNPSFVVPSGPSGVWRVRLYEASANVPCASASFPGYPGSPDVTLNFDVARAVIIGAVASGGVGGDSWVSEQNAGSVQTGDLQIESKSGQNKRIFARFNLTGAGITGTVNSALLRMQLVSAGSNFPRTHSAHRVTSTWLDSTITWSSPSPAPFFATPTDSQSAPKTPLPALLRWSVTSDVQGFVNSTFTNFGWCIKDATEGASGNNNGSYKATEANTATDKTQGPVLLVDYSAASPTPTSTPTATATATATATPTATATFTPTPTPTPTCNPPSVGTNPISQTVTYGTASVNFTASATGTPAPTVQWQISTGGGPFTDIGGATNTTLTILNPTVAMSDNQYRAVFTSTCAPGTATSTAATLTVNQASLTITANNASKTYGDTYAFDTTTPSTDFSVSGTLYFSDSVNSVTLSSAGTAATATFVAPGPTYAITVSDAVGTGLSNYAISYTPGTLAITQASLTVAAHNVSKIYGDEYTFDTTTPSTDFGVAGLKNSDTVASVALSSAGAAAAATFVAPGPTYAITVSAASGTGLGNYIISYTPATLTITQASLAVAANNVSKTYGDAYIFDTTTPSSDFSVTGLKNSDTVDSVTLGSAGSAATATFVAPGPIYAITVGGASGTGLGNYIISYTPSTLTITQAALTVTANNASKTYGSTYTFDTTTPSTDFSVSGLKNSDTVDSVTLGSAGAAGTATFVAPGPTYAITVGSASGTGLGNYIISYTPGTLTITQASLAVAVNDASKTYGDTYVFDTTPPSVDFTVTGTLYNGDAVDSVTLSSDGAAATATFVAPGPTYAITVADASGPGLGNYIINYTPGTLTIIQASLAVAANNVSKTYGDTYVFDTTTPSTDFSVTGLKNSDTVGSVMLSSAGAAAAATFVVPGPTYAITVGGASGTGLGNYLISYTPATLTITQAALTVAVNNVSKIYGDAYTFDTTTPSTDFSATGLKNSDTVDSVTLSSTGAAATATFVVPGPTYAITISDAAGTGLGNYLISYTPGTLTITQAALTVQANNVSKTYGSTYTFDTTGPSTDFSVAGLKNSDAVDTVDLSSAGAAGTATFVAPGPTYPITVSNAIGTGLGNYITSYTPGTLTITQAPLTVHANNASKTYGDTYTFDTTTPSSDFSVTGTLYNGETVDSVTLSSTGAVATATFVAPGPTYGITVSAASGTGLGNYIISYAPGTLTITQAALTVAATSVGKTYGDTYTFDTTTPSGDFSFTGLKNSDSVDSVALSSAGAVATATFVAPGPTYTITVGSASGTGVGNYIISYTPATLTITQAALSVAASNVSKVYGVTYTFNTTTPSTDFSVVGLKNSDTVASVTLSSAGVAAAATFVAPGPTYAITVGSASGTGLGNYIISYMPATLEITQATLTITATNHSKVIGATYTPNTTTPPTDFTVGGLVNGNTVTSITLTCAGYAAAALPQPTPYPIVPSAAMGTGLGNYTIGYVNGQFTIGYGTCTGSNGPGGVILQPIDADGSSIFPKAGRTVPVKFTLCDANGNPISNPNAVFAGTGGALTMLSAVRGQIPNPDETAVNEIPDAAFRYSSGIWIFNMASSNLQSGYTYRFRINLANGQGITFQIAIK